MNEQHKKRWIEMKESITSVCGRMIKVIAVLMAVTTVFMSVGLSAGAPDGIGEPVPDR